MNRRFLLLGLVVVVPLGVGWWAKRVASDRPVAMGKVAVVDPATFNPNEDYLSASLHQVLSVRLDHLPTGPSYNSGLQTHGTLFDLQSGGSKSFFHPAQRQYTGLEGDEVWGLCYQKGTHAGYVEIEGTNKKFSFQAPDFDFDLLDQRQPVLFRLFPSENRAVLLCINRVYTWNLQTARLEKNARFEDARCVDPTTVLARDARTFVHCELGGFRIGDVRTGKTLKWTAFPDFNSFESLYPSPYGRYVLFKRANSSLMQVADTSNGKSLWSFSPPSSDAKDWTISDDERTIFVHKDNSWEVRDLNTGAIRGTLPWVPGTSAVASALDGTTLYYVAMGKLYWQSVA